MAGTLKQVRIIRAWKNYRVGETLVPNGTVRDYLVNGGYAEIVGPAEAEAPSRPARMARSAAKKVADGAKRLFA